MAELLRGTSPLSSTTTVSYREAGRGSVRVSVRGSVRGKRERGGKEGDSRQGMSVDTGDESEGKVENIV